MNNQPTYQVVYQGKTHAFQHGAQLYIFDYGLYHNIHKRGINVLLSFIQYVYNCYMKDCNHTPLGALTDYVAEHWDDIQKQSLGSYDLLEEFYMQLD